MSGARLIIGGDVAPVGGDRPAFVGGNAEALFDPALLRRFLAADARIVNLEAPLVGGHAVPINKNGPHLRAEEAAANGIAMLGVTLASLANNHILDFGAAGLDTTRRALAARGILCVGAGDTAAEAAAPVILNLDGRRIGVYACAEHEFSCATDALPGANAFDPLATPDQIAALRARCDYVVVLFHGGREEYPYPTPEQRRVCRYLAEKGANLVLCQHSHCPGCMEEHAGATLVYGQGNLLFDAPDGGLDWHRAVLAEVEFPADGGTATVSLLPVERVNGRVCAAPEDAPFYKGFLSRSAELQTPGAVEARFAAVAAQKRNLLLRICLGNGFFVRLLDRLSGRRVSKLLFSEAALLALENQIACESHRELLLAAIRTPAEADRGEETAHGA